MQKNTQSNWCFAEKFFDTDGGRVGYNNLCISASGTIDFYFAETAECSMISERAELGDFAVGAGSLSGKLVASENPVFRIFDFYGIGTAIRIPRTAASEKNDSGRMQCIQNHCFCPKFVAEEALPPVTGPVRLLSKYDV